ncbi:MAG: hypothetical protein B6D58_06710 [candidate division Zixibacteria bacterium 4484_95]|nr:MAG: hypothetical protein B6D58_06710 [candidate division Zixibacteria bacterium 4484_95]
MWRWGRHWKHRENYNDTGSDDMLYLSEAGEGKVYVMLGVGGGQRLRQKLYSMGLNPGVKFRVITNNGRGPVGVEVRDTRLAIGRGMAQRVKIRENGS